MSDWTTTRIGDLLRPSNERSISNDQYPVLTSSRSGLHLQSEYFNRVVASKDNTGYKVIRNGQFTYRAMSDDGFFRFNRLTEHEAGIISPAYEVFECSTENADPAYMDYLLNSDIVLSQIYGAAQGGTRLSLRLSTLSEFEAAVPPLPEQKKIAEILSGIESNLNMVTEEIGKINNLEKCLLSSLFSENEGVEWKKVAVTNIGRVIRGASPRPKGDPRYYGGKVPRLMVADVTRDGKYVTPRIDFLTEEGAKLSRPVPAGTLTIVCSGVVGVPSILSVDACIHDGFLAIVDISPECNTEYLYYFFKPLQQLFDSSATHGGIFTNLTTEILKDFPVLIPSLAKQEEIARILRSVDSHRNILLSKQSKLVCLFESISSDLLSGRKRASV
jgi:type I restriction enzyme S subunit